MRKKIDFSNATRGPLLDTTGKEYIAIWLDSDVYEYFGSLAEKRGRGYQGLIDAALRSAMDADDERLDDIAPSTASEDDVTDTMREEGDFSNATRGPVIDTTGKGRFPLWLDSDVLSHFRKLAVSRGTGDQGLINEALRDAMQADAPCGDGPAEKDDRARAIGDA